MALGLWSVSPTEVAAQNIVWSVVDCSQSRLVAPSGATCRGTNRYAGDNGVGEFQIWSIRGNSPYQYLILNESLNSSSSIRFTNTTEEYLRRIGPGKNATGFSGKLHRNGADYFTFTSKAGEECTGFRRGGPSRSVGYLWVLGGILCLTKGEKLDQARIFKFMDDAQVK
ncbi:MAG: hypothetical protein Q8L39_09025 [Burkholderiales bacterium]|nr:hypothetical protein [Burkholderiales bacterium]